MSNTILLVHPNGAPKIYQGLSNDFSARENPIWCGLIHSYLKRKGIESDILDCEVNCWTVEQSFQEIKSKNPKIVALVIYGNQPSASSQVMYGAELLSEKLKELNVVRIYIGPTPTSLPNHIINRDKSVFVCAGEGLKTLEALSQIKDFHNITELEKVPGLCFYDINKNQVIQNLQAPLITNLDEEMPSMSFDILPMDKYRTSNWHGWTNFDQYNNRPFASIYSSLGCPYQCVFCLDGNTKITTLSSLNKKIKDINIGDKILSYNINSLELEESTVLNISKRKINKVLRIKFNDGQIIFTSEEHPFYIKGNWVQAKDLKIGDVGLILGKYDKNSFQMRRDNPMKIQEVRDKQSITIKKKIANGEVVPFMNTPEGIKIITEKARERAINDNPMKRMTPEQKAKSSERWKKMNEKLWSDPEFREKQKKSGNYYLRPGNERFNWNGGSSLEPYGKEFNKKLKTKIRERDNHTCQECKKTNVNLDVHHIDYNKKNNEECNLICLCDSCHPKTNGNREKWKAHYQEIMSSRGKCPFESKIISIKEIKGERDVYNFECDKNNNYFANRILVHNCMINSPFNQGDNKNNSIRLFNVEHILKSLEYLSNLGITNLKIADELFILYPKHFMAICEGIINRGLKFNIWCYSRVNTIFEKYLVVMRKAGIRWVGLGIESGSQMIRQEASKGKFQEVHIKDIVKKIMEHDICVTGNYIFGLPHDTRETMQQTLDLALELNTDYSNFYCLKGDTYIDTPIGIKQISKIKEGDFIYSQNGESKVLKTSSRLYNGNIYKIKARYLKPIEITEEHPILIARLKRDTSNVPQILNVEFRKPKDLKIFNNNEPMLEYDAVMIKKQKEFTEDTYLHLSKYVKTKKPNGKDSQLNPRAKKYLQPIKVTEEIAELFGWYVAEGSLASRENNLLCFSLHRNETEHIARIQFLLKKCFDFKSRVFYEDNNSRIIFNSKVFLRAAYDIFGKNAYTKKVPECILKGKRSIIEAFFKGYKNGDGTSYPNSIGQNNVSSASLELILQLQYLYFKIGKIYGYGESKAKDSIINGRITHSNINYRLSWIEEPNSKHYLEDENFIYIPIKKVEIISFNDNVYNIKTEDETYSIPFIVHNCAMAYPGSQLNRDWSKSNPSVLPENNECGWLGYSQHAYETFNLPTESLTNSEVLKFRENAFQTYFTNSSYLERMTKKFGQPFKQEIDKMMGVKLKRKILGD